MNGTHSPTPSGQHEHRGAVLLRAIVGDGPAGRYLEGPARIVQRLIEAGDARAGSRADKLEAWPNVHRLD
jgi:hypothetical protein